jgi:membrane associated rhomboid family serine protease
MNPSPSRARVLSTLLADPAATLVEHDEGCTRVLTQGEEIALLDLTGDALQARLATLLRTQKTMKMIFVVFDASEATIGILTGANSFWQLRLQQGFYVGSADGEGELKNVAGIGSKVLLAAARLTPTPLDPDVIAARLRDGEARRTEVTTLAESLGKHVPVATIAIGAVCVALFLLGALWGRGQDDAILGRLGANIPERVKAGEVWRIFSSAFLHLNLMHLLFNMLALASFGFFLERLLGPSRFLVLYGLSALGGGVASAFLGKHSASVGASGAIWGLMTAGVALALRPRGLIPPLTLAAMKKRAVGPLLINLVYSLQPGIDIWAHLGGGIVGFLLILSGVITRGVEPQFGVEPAPAAAAPRTRSRLVDAAAALVCAVLLGSTAVALVNGRPWAAGDPPVLHTVALGDSGLQVDLPVSLGDAKITHQHAATVYSFGSLSNDPMGVEVVVAPISAPPDASAFLTELGHSIKPPEGATQVAAPQLVTVEGRPSLKATWQHKNGVVVRFSGFVLGDRLAVLRVYSVGDGPKAWSGVEPRAAASLR